MDARICVRQLAGGPTRLRAFTLEGKPAGEVTLPDFAAVDEMEALGDDLLYSVETYLAPNRFYRLSGGRSIPTALAVTSPVKFDDVEVVRAFATPRDGTRVPVNIIRRKVTKLDGSNPTLLYGYGGYGVSQTPGFIGGTRRVWFDAGGSYAIANVRGGSNGGLLVGAVVAQVAIFHMLRVELDPNGQFNITEFGTVRNPDQFRALFAYSPCHQVRDGAKYPAVFLSTGENDGRANPANSRKMAARQQAATSSGLPVYLVTTDAAGHGQGSPLSVQIDQMADYLAFPFDQLGMALP